MSITEWVLDTYKAQESGLEEAKNSTCIWRLFENQSRNRIFIFSPFATAKVGDDFPFHNLQQEFL